MNKYLLLSALLCIPSSIATEEPEQKNTPIKSSEEFDEILYSWTRTLAEIFQLTKQKHYKVANLEDALVKAADAFLSNLDPHAGFLDPKTYKSMTDSLSGQFYGIGVVIDNTRKPKDKWLTIIDTIADGPADKAGIKPHDKMVEIDGKLLEGMTTEEATCKLKGDRNTTVQIKLLREGQNDLLTFDITRDIVKEQNALSFHIPSHNITYISLATFSRTAMKQIEKFLREAQSKKCNGLIIDLRYNGGGLVTAAVDTAGLFLEKGSLVAITQDKSGKTTHEFKTTREPIATSIPICILINNFTASAAEILAANLKNLSEKSQSSIKPIVILVGTDTFGKGTMQEVIPVSTGNGTAMGGGAVRITTAVYKPAGHIDIQGIGIKPDFYVERMTPPNEQANWFVNNFGRESNLPNSIKTPEAEKEQQAQKAKKQSCTEASKPTRWSERVKELLQTDNQLREAIVIINLLSTFCELCPERVNSREKALELLKKALLSEKELDIQEVKR